MAAAPFQVVSVLPAAHLPVPCQPDARAGSWAEISQSCDGRFTLGFISVDNRSLVEAVVSGSSSRFRSPSSRSHRQVVDAVLVSRRDSVWNKSERK
jgi:hypothetical protein